MNNKYTSFSLLFIIYFPLYGMNEKKLYEEFKLTSSYGTLKSNFDCFPAETIATITHFLQENIIKKFKRDLLIDKSHNKNLKIKDLNLSTNTIFRHHDGTYNIVPDMGKNYVMWDELNNKKKLLRDLITLTTKKSETDIEVCIALDSITSEKLPLRLSFPITEYTAHDKKNFYIITEQSPFADYIIQRKVTNDAITHYLFSYDHEWLALGTSGHNENFALFNLCSQKVTYTHSLNGSISALCTAHHSPFFVVGSQNGDLCLITLDCPFNFKNINKKRITAVQFSPNDTRFFYCKDNQLTLCNLITISSQKKPVLCHQNTSLIYEYFIEKAFFSSDNTIIVALSDGQLFVINNITSDEMEEYKARWRLFKTMYPNNQTPLMLHSNKHNLLFLFNVEKDIEGILNRFTIRELLTGKWLISQFFPGNSKAMGLTEDENNIIFIHEDNSTSLLNLYDNQDLQNINFIEKEANMYQLCLLYYMYKNSENDFKKQSNRNAHATEFVTTITSFIQKYSKKISA